MTKICKDVVVELSGFCGSGRRGPFFCIATEIDKRRVGIGMPPALSCVDREENAVRELEELAHKAGIQNTLLRNYGINTVIGNYHYPLSYADIGSIAEDYLRVIPKTVIVDPEYAAAQGDLPPVIANGFCNSFADHVVYSNYNKRENDTLRIFESRDAKEKIEGEEWRNYKVYWLTTSGLGHIYDEHGYKNKVPRVDLFGGDDKPDTRFYEQENIVKLLQGFITTSKPEERGFLSGKSVDTTFQRKYGRNIGQSKTFDKYNPLLKLYSDRLQVRTDSGTEYKKMENRIETAFPLYRGFNGINSD